MSERLPASLCLLFAVLLLSACGNKADLFLPDDPQLSEDLNSVSNTEVVPGAVPEAANDDVTVEDPADSDKSDKRTPDK